MQLLKRLQLMQPYCPPLTIAVAIPPNCSGILFPSINTWFGVTFNLETAFTIANNEACKILSLSIPSGRKLRNWQK